jgi:hypothetical protein
MKSSYQLLLRLAVFSLVLGVILPAHAQSTASNSKPIRAEKLQSGETITLDGTLSHPAWQRATAHDEFTEKDPVQGRTPTYKTRLRVLYDDKAIYAGVEALDPDPSQIRANQVRHDQVLRTQDFVALYIDPQGDRKAAQFFRVNSQGYVGEGLHTAVDDNEDFLPDYDFSAAAKPSTTGYTAVFRIPFSSLRYDPTSNKPWTIMLARRIPRAENYLLMSVNLPKDSPHFLREMQTLENFTPPKSGTYFQLRPTITARAIEERSPVATREYKFKPSVDFKWQPRNEWVIDGTLNPDFSQLELDVVELSRNSKFALFKQEKRPVFLESRDLISVQNNAIYTRAITDPRWAIRSTWRDENLSGSVIATQDKGGGLTIIPGTYYNDYATQPGNQTVIGRGLYKDYGIVIARRQYDNGKGSNNVLAVDRSFEVNSSWRSRLQAQLSQTDALPDGNGTLAKGQSQNGAFLSSNFQYSTEELGGSFDANIISKNFRNDVGFITQTGEYDISGYIGRKFRQPKFFQNIFAGFSPNFVEFYVNSLIVKDTANHQLIKGYVTPGFYLETNGGLETKLELRAISPVRGSANSKLMHERYVFGFFSLPVNSVLLNVNGNYDIGGLADYSVDKVRPAQRVNLAAKIRPFAFTGAPISDRLEIEPSFNTLRFHANGQTTTNESSNRLLTIFHVSPGQSIRFITQNTRYNRRAEPLLSINADASKSQTQSLTYIWRQSASDALYIGGSRSLTKSPFSQSLSAAKTESREWFIKWQKQL